MAWENPFVLRELRQLARRPRPLRIWGVGAVLATLLYVLLLLRIGPPPYQPGYWIPELLLALVPWHAVMCLQAGLYGSNRVFADEHRRATLEGLFLLPASPARWLAAKLLFPLLLVLLAWAAGMPFYVFPAALGMAPATAVHQAAMPALFAGLGVLPVLLLLPPDYRERLQRLEVHTGGPAPRLDGDLQSRLLLLALGVVTFTWLAIRPIFGGPGRSTTLPFYSTWAPQWAIWLAAVVPFAVAAGLTALATASRQERHERAALWARGSVTVCLHFLFLAGLWKLLPHWVQAVLLVLPLVVLLPLLRKPRPKEDPLSTLEIDWIAQRWDNPLLIRDLRVYSRLSSIRRGVLGRGIPVAILLAAQAIGISWALQGMFASKVHPLAWIFGCALSLPVVLLPAVQASQSWLKERRAETLQMLLLTPQKPGEMIRARLLAGTLYYGVVYAPVLLVILAAPATREAWVVGPMLLAFAPQWYAGILAVESAERPESPGAPGTEVTPAAALLILGSAGCILGTLYLCFSLAAEMEPWRVWVTAACIAAIGVGIGWLATRVRAEQLQSLRAGGLEEVFQPRESVPLATRQELSG